MTPLPEEPTRLHKAAEFLSTGGGSFVDKREEFNEDDEDPAAIHEAWLHGEKGITALPNGQLVRETLNVGNVPDPSEGISDEEYETPQELLTDLDVVRHHVENSSWPNKPLCRGLIARLDAAEAVNFLRMKELHAAHQKIADLEGALREIRVQGPNAARMIIDSVLPAEEKR